MSAVFQIPSTPNGTSTWTQRTTLGGVVFVLSFAWVQRIGHWMLTVSDVNGVDIATGRVLVPNWSLLRHVTDARWVGGNLVCDDLTGAQSEPTFVSLGSQHVLLWVSP